MTKKRSQANKKGPARVGELLASVLKQAGSGREYRPESISVVAAWPEIVGQRFGKISRAINLTDGKLYVEVASPAWKQELLLSKNTIIFEIREKLGLDLVADLVLNVREFKHGQ